MKEPPAGCRSSLRRRTATGACWFRDEAGRSCAIHRRHGDAVLPSACRQFPRICVLEPELISVSLSHYCPTAAGLLFEGAGAFHLVSAPAAFPADWPFEGLDVRQAYPPFLRPGVLLGFDGLRVFEDLAVDTLSRKPLWTALSVIGSAVKTARTWTANEGALPNWLADSFGRAAVATGSEPETADPRPVLLGSLTEGIVPRAGLPPFRSEQRSLSTLADSVLRRYLASRLIAAWITFQGNDLRCVVRYLRLCLYTVLLFESALIPKDDEATRWKGAVRDADLWILHYCDPERLARNLS